MHKIRAADFMIKLYGMYKIGVSDRERVEQESWSLCVLRGCFVEDPSFILTKNALNVNMKGLVGEGGRGKGWAKMATPSALQGLLVFKE